MEGSPECSRTTSTSCVCACRKISTICSKFSAAESCCAAVAGSNAITINSLDDNFGALTWTLSGKGTETALFTNTNVTGAATINAAYSLKRGHEIGSLEPGKLADFAIHDCDDYRELPYFFGRDTALAVYVNGSPVHLRDSHL